MDRIDFEETMLKAQIRPPRQNIEGTEQQKSVSPASVLTRFQSATQ